MWYNYNNMMGFGFFGGFMMLVFWVIVIMLIVWAVKEVAGKNSRSAGNNALDILKERYAKGEINKEEFESKKKDLRD